VTSDDTNQAVKAGEKTSLIMVGNCEQCREERKYVIAGWAILVGGGLLVVVLWPVAVFLAVVIGVAAVLAVLVSWMLAIGGDT